MKLEVFDDKLSLLHLLAGALSYFIPVIFILFIFYEIIEHVYKHKQEKEVNFLGDIVEFLFGLGAITSDEVNKRILVYRTTKRQNF